MDHAVEMPRLQELGRDLLHVSRWHVAVSIVRPAVCFALFWALSYNRQYLAAVVAVAALMFFTYTSTSHDLVHRTLHLPPWINEPLLAVFEGIALRSGHAFRITHLYHHRHFPEAGDIEAARASRGFWPALLCGPGHQIRMFAWAWKRGASVERRWMFSEAVWVLSVETLAILNTSRFPQLALYCVLVILGSWLYPLATVWWPHRADGNTVLTQTRGFRGRLIPAIFFQHTYHLEHHLYPGVSSHHWAQLARRLEPHLAKAGVALVRIP